MHSVVITVNVALLYLHSVISDAAVWSSACIMPPSSRGEDPFDPTCPDQLSWELCSGTAAFCQAQSDRPDFQFCC